MTALAVEAGLLREMKTFRQTLHEAGDADLVDHFRELAGAGGAHQPAGAGEGGDHRLGLARRARLRRRT